MGINYSMTGVFYNKAFAAKIGMTSAPSTLAQLDADLAKAKAAGVLPVEQFDSAGNGGLIFPLQYLMADYNIASRRVGIPDQLVGARPAARYRRYRRQPPGRQPSGRVDQGRLFQLDANAVSYSTMMGRFEHGQGLFIFDGDWESGNFDSNYPPQVRLLPLPAAHCRWQAGRHVRPLTYGIAAGAKHANCAAYFLNWVGPTLRPER